MKKFILPRPIFLALIFLIVSQFAIGQSNPIALNDTVSIKKYYKAWFNLLLNDYDPNGDAIAIAERPEAAVGLVWSHNDSSIWYQNYVSSGTDSLMYKISKTGQPEFMDSAWVFIEVTDNELPEVAPDTLAIITGQEIIINIYDHAFDPDGDDFEIKSVGDPNHGDASKESDSTLSVIITENFQGIDQVRISLKELTSGAISSRYSIYLEVSYNPDYPFALNDTVTVMQGDTITMEVLANDFDPQSDQLYIFDVEEMESCEYFSWDDQYITIVPLPNAQTGLVNYFSYYNAETQNIDHVSNEAFGFLHILENPNLPLAINDTATTVAGFPVEIPVLTNDIDINGDSLLIMSAGQYFDKGLLGFSDSIITFTPYSYLAEDVHLYYYIKEKNNPPHYAKANIVVQVTENHNQPVANDDSITAHVFEAFDINPLKNDTDPDGMTIEIAEISDPLGLTKINSVNDSTVEMEPYENFGGTVSVPYRFARSDNPAMISNEANIHVTFIPDESTIYGRADTVFYWPGLRGTKNILMNDHNPNSDSIAVHYIDDKKGLKTWVENDSVIGYSAEFSLTEPVETSYWLIDNNIFAGAAGKICFMPTVQRTLIDTLDANNIKASFSAVGMHYYDPAGFSSGLFEVPKGSGKRTIDQNSLWIGGISNNKLYTAAESFRMNGEDFWPGPVSEEYKNEDLAKYRIWKITPKEIDYHIAHHKDPGYVPIESIATWPGNGDLELGQAKLLAPFFDQNGDDIYNPLDGDVPLIRGDQSLYFIFNDGYGLHSETDGRRMQLEIHGNAYAFDQPNDSALFNTIFLHYDFINRSGRIYEDVYIGMHTNFYLGYPGDDYVRCDVGRGNAFVYNAVETDGNGQPYAYGANPPVQGITILGGPLMPEDNMDNASGGCDESINGMNFEDGIVDNERMGMTKFGTYYMDAVPGWARPQYASQYFSWLTGHWNTGCPWNYTNVGPVCSFVLPGDSDPLNWGTGCEYPNGGFNQNGNYWTEETEGEMPGYKFGVSITGPFTFAPGEMQSLDVAFVYARDNDTTDQLSTIDIMNQRIDTIRQRVQNGGIIYFPDYNVRINENSTRNLEIPVFPNPVSDEGFYIDLRQINYSGEAQFFIHDMMGRTIQNGFLSYGKTNPIQIPGIKTGIYVIVIKLGDNTAIQKLVIRR